MPLLSNDGWKVDCGGGGGAGIHPDDEPLATAEG